MRGNNSGYTTNGSFTGQQSIESLNQSIASKEAENYLLSTMPNYAKANTPIDKFTSYSLNPENPQNSGKAEAYKRALGYTKTNASELKNKIHNAIITGTAKPYEVVQSNYGTKYKYRISITGPNGKTKNVIAVYQIDKGCKIPRMVTNYVEGK
jgi:hypothetical protein